LPLFSAGRISSLPKPGANGHVFVRTVSLPTLAGRALCSIFIDSAADSGGKAMSEHVYRVIEVVGSSPKGIEGAIENAVEKANKTLRELRWFEVIETRGHVEGGKVSHYQVKLKLAFTLE
jgi:hypothetical protein